MDTLESDSTCTSMNMDGYNEKKERNNDNDVEEAKIASRVAIQSVRKRKCFTSIQQRRFWTNICNASISLCPSMDLICFGASSSATTKITPVPKILPTESHQKQNSVPVSSIPMTAEFVGCTSIQLHRTVNWQKLATATVTSSSSSSSVLQTHAVWRPDGRFLAIADTLGRVSILSVEDMLNNMSNNNNSSNPMSSLSESTELPSITRNTANLDISTGGELDSANKVLLITLPRQKPDASSDRSSDTTPAMISGLSWAHFGQNYPGFSIRKNVRKHNEINNANPCFSDDDDCDDEEESAELMWKYRSQFVDREHIFLPPSEYHVRSNLITGTASNSSLPTCQTPLSILYVATTGLVGVPTIEPENEHVNEDCSPSAEDRKNRHRHHLNIYLHNRYSIATQLDLGETEVLKSMNDLTLAPSADLTHIIIGGYSIANRTTLQNEPLINLYSIPAITKNRYTFQQISTLYSKISTHLHAIHGNVTTVVASFRAALKPLDLKLDSMYKLLQSYGLIIGSSNEENTGDEQLPLPSSTNNESPSLPLRPLLVQYILSGHTRTSPNLCNALDQFFTSPQMNDQLLLRLDRSLATAVSNVETSLKQSLLAPAIALHYSVDALHGLGTYRPDIFSQSSISSSALSALDQLLLTTELLVISIEAALTELIDARFRLRDFLAWLRSTGSQIKARGTAPKSVQRDNAKKRRVPDVVVHRMLSYLREGQQEDFVNDQLHNGSSIIGTTEGILALKFSPMLKKDQKFVCSDALSLQSISALESNVHSSNISSSRVNSNKRTTPTVPHVLEKTVQAAERVFELPRDFVKKSIRRTTLRLQDMQSFRNKNHGNGNFALTTRLGRGGDSNAQEEYYRESRSKRFFLPTTHERDTTFESAVRSPLPHSFRQWSVIAQVSDTNELLLVTFPLKWTVTTDTEYVDDDDHITSSIEANTFSEDHHGLAAEFHWSCLLSFPEDCLIKDVAFYNDDGKSSLQSSSSDSTGAREEGRQALGVLLSSPKVDPENSSQNSYNLELWILDYDSLPYTCLPIGCRTKGLNGDIEAKLSLRDGENALRVVFVKAMSDQHEDDKDEGDLKISEDIYSVFAKTREIGVSVSSLELDYSACRIVLSGSRGMGAVFVRESAGSRTSMELLDLEEDDDVEDVVDNYEKDDEQMETIDDD